MTGLPQGSTIGILGAGQLGRMLAMAAARLGYKAHVYAPEPGSAMDVTSASTLAAYDDAAALRAFGRACDVVTCEFETIPLDALEVVARRTPLRPGRRAMAVAQDRLAEKDFLTGLNLRTARYRDVPNAGVARALLADIGTPAILKTRRMGYDGKGQARVETADAVEAAMRRLDGVPAILESVVRFEREVSVIVARGTDGTVVAYDPGENAHEDGILRTTTVPAQLSSAQDAEARAIAARIATALDYVGVMGVELFVLPDALLVNEIAPRVHNSGHWTQAGCAVDQFEQHVRAVAGLPLGEGTRHADVVMRNLIGPDDVASIDGLAASGGTQLHLYGKAEARAGRKMGHVNAVGKRSFK